VALVLAIESDSHQAGLLERIVREEVPADLVVSDSKDSAIASIAKRLPDLILVSALMSPREEAELTEHLRGLENADHLQTLTIPLLASKPARRPAGDRMLRALKWRRAQALEGCDPSIFAEDAGSSGMPKRRCRSSELRRWLQPEQPSNPLRRNSR
jgi:CheY-like chemotaxis protein